MLFLLAREHPQDPVDRLPGVYGMQRTEDDVSGLGRGHGNFERLWITNLTDQNCFWRLAQSRAQSVGEAGKILV